MAKKQYIEIVNVVKRHMKWIVEKMNPACFAIFTNVEIADLGFMKNKHLAWCRNDRNKTSNNLVRPSGLGGQAGRRIGPPGSRASR